MTANVSVKITRVRPGRDLPLPRYMTADAAGMDLFASVNGDVTLEPGERALLPTGIAVAIPRGYEAQVRPRSGLALRHGITVLNAPGTIDADYRGEIQVLLANLGREAFVVRRADRIAQLVLAPVSRVAWNEVARLPSSERDEGGFGHTDGERSSADRSGEPR